MTAMRRLGEHGALVCAVLGFLVFVPSLWAGYPLDDEFIARGVDASGRVLPLVGSLGSLGDYFASHWWFGYYEATELFRPITKLSLALVYAGFGVEGDAPAFAQHLLNLIAYSWCCALVFSGVTRVADARAAWIAGLVFALHPLHCEAVCTLTGRAELFALAFGMQAVVLLLPASGARPGLLRCAGAALCFFAAFGSKESALAWVPAALAIVAFARGARAAPRAAISLVPGVVAFFGLRASMIAQLSAEPAPTTVFANPLVALAPWERVADAIEVLGFGFARLVFPVGLSVDYGPSVFSVGDGFADPGAWLSLLALCALVALAALLRRRFAILGLGLVLYACFAFLTSNLAFPIGTIFGERLLFAPSFAFALLVGGLASELRLPPRAGLVVLAAWLVYAAGYSCVRSSHFESSASIALHDAAVQPRSANLQRLASDAYVQQGDRGAAIEALERAVRLDPRFGAAWLNLASLVREAGQKARAEQLLKRGLRECLPSMRRERAMLHASLATSLAARGAREEALVQLDAALELDPGNAGYAQRRAQLR